MKKLTLFSGYFILKNYIYSQEEARIKLEEMLVNRNVYEVISTLNGSFRFVIDSEDTSYFGIDHFGGYALFYKCNPNLEIYTNPISHCELAELDDNQLCSILASGFCYGNATLFKNLKEVNPGTLYTFDKINGILTTQEWFKINFDEQEAKTATDLAELFLSLIPHNMPDNTLALTGGIDSRLILSLFSKSNINFNTVTYGTKDNPDSKLVKSIAQAAKIDHTQFQFDQMNLSEFFQKQALKDFLEAGFLSRSLPFESDWILSNMLKSNTKWLTTGFTSFWLRPPYQDTSPIKTKDELMSKLLKSQCNQTLISSKRFKQIILDNLTESLLDYNSQDYDAMYDRWNVENRQHKYIINTSYNYRFNDIEVYMPLFDRRIMEFINTTPREDRLEQKLFMQAVCENIFVDKESYLKDIPSTNPKFNNYLLGNKVKTSTWKKRILSLDSRNLYRLFRKPNNPMYQIIQTVLLQSNDFLSQKVETVYPNLSKIISTLYDLKMFNSAKHLEWLKKEDWFN